MKKSILAGIILGFGLLTQCYADELSVKITPQPLKTEDKIQIQVSFSQPLSKVSAVIREEKTTLQEIDGYWVTVVPFKAKPNEKSLTVKIFAMDSQNELHSQIQEINIVGAINHELRPIKQIIPTPNVSETQSKETESWSRKGKIYLGGLLRNDFVGIKQSGGSTSYDNGSPMFPDINNLTSLGFEARYGINEKMMVGVSYESLSAKFNSSGTIAAASATATEELSSNHLGIKAYYYFINTKKGSLFFGGAYKFYSPIFHISMAISGQGSGDISVSTPVNSPFEVFTGIENELMDGVFLTGQVGYRFLNLNGTGKITNSTCTGSFVCTPAGTTTQVSGMDLSGLYLNGGIGTYF